MSHPPESLVTAELFETAIRDAMVKREREPLRWAVRGWTSALATVAVFVFLLPIVIGDGAEAFDPTGYRLWTRLVMGSILAIAISVGAKRRLAKQAANPPAAAQQLAAEYSGLVGPGWMKRTVTMGVKLGLGVGIPIGLLLALLPIEPDVTFLGRIGSFVAFVALTLCWAVPMGFGIRWLSLHYMRRYVAPPK